MSKHLLDFKDIEKKDIEKLIDITGKLNPEKTDQISSISLLKFDEPSTRTRLSFSVAAYTLGATWIERHVTLDRTWKGTDHAASLEPTGLKKLARDLKATHKVFSYKKTEILTIEQVQRDKLKFRK